MSDGRIERRTSVSAQRVLAVLAALGSPALCTAQNNSLFRPAPALRAAPAQPVPAQAPAPGAQQAAPASPAGPAMGQAPNPVLLQLSPIAVSMPEPEKIKVHDLVTIIIREDKRSTTDAKLESDKEWKIDSELSKWLRIHNHKLAPQVFPEGAPGVQFDHKDEYDGEGKVERRDSLNTRITAQVIDVKPNGTLILEAKKEIKVDEETQTYTLTGICRGQDVTAQNTVLSTQLADLQVTVEHSGAARDAARRGWIKRLADFLRPI